jgi:hypothetical protein
MKRLLSTLLLIAPLAVLAQQPAANAQSWNLNYQGYGNNGTGVITGPGGYRGTYQQQRIGDTIYSNTNSRYGRSSCTTQYIGNQAFSNCR